MTSYMVSIEPLVTAKMIDGAVTIAVAALADLTMRRRNSGSSSLIIGLESFYLEQPHIGERLAGDIRFPFFAHFDHGLDSCGHHRCGGIKLHKEMNVNNTEIHSCTNGLRRLLWT